MKRLRNKVSPGRLKNTASSVLGSVQAVPRKSSNATRSALGRVRIGSSQALDSARRHANGLLATTQGLLASALSTDLNGLLASMVDGPATIYDKAMDAVYLATRIGGENHRMFDGGHTILGAFRAVRDASPDDTIVEEAMGFLQSLFRDMTTAKGLPLANWDKATYDKVAGFLASELRIPKDWFYDINSYDAAQLLCGVIGVVATALCWNRADTEAFAKLVGGMGVSALARANPLLLLVTVVALARAFHKAHHAGEYAELVDGQLKGGVSAGATLVAASQVATLGGPAGLALLVGLTAGVLVHKATQNVSVVEIGEFLAERATMAATEVRAMTERYTRTADPTSPSRPHRTPKLLVVPAKGVRREDDSVSTGDDENARAVCCEGIYRVVCRLVQIARVSSCGRHVGGMDYTCDRGIHDSSWTDPLSLSGSATNIIERPEAEQLLRCSHGDSKDLAASAVSGLVTSS